MEAFGTSKIFIDIFKMFVALSALSGLSLFSAAEQPWIDITVIDVNVKF